MDIPNWLEVAKDFVNQTSRASSDRQTAVQITAEVLQLTRAVLRKHQHGGDAFRYHLAQPYRMLAREFVHRNRNALRRMKPKCSVRNPWLIIFTRNMPFEIFETLKVLIVAGELGTGKSIKACRSTENYRPKKFPESDFGSFEQAQLILASSCLAYLCMHTWDSNSLHQQVRNSHSDLLLSFLHSKMKLTKHRLHHPCQKEHHLLLNLFFTLVNWIWFCAE